MLFGEWFCVGRLDDLGLAVPKRVVAVDVAGESVLVTSDEDGALHAAYNVCRHRGSQLLRARRSRARDAGVACAAPTTRGPTGSTARCCKAPHADGRRPRRRSRCTRSASRPGRGSSSCTSRPRARRAARRAGRARRRGAGQLRPRRPGHRHDAALRGRAPTTRCCSRTTTSATTAGRCTPSCRRLVPAFAGGGAGLDWDDGIPHREGAWTFTMTGTTTRAPLPGLDERRADPAQGRPRLPQPDALGLGRPRRGVRAAARARVDRTEVDLLAAVRPRRGGGRRASTRATPPSCGTWSTSRTGRSASRCSAACPRAPTRTAGSRRWRTTASTSGAGCCRGSSDRGHVDERAGRLRRRRAGRRSAARPRWELARRGHRVLGLERFELGHSRGASHDTSRILRHSYHTPAYVRLTQEAYADWARLERESGEPLVTTVGGLDLFPPDPAIPRDRLHAVDGRGRASPTRCSTRTRWRRAGRSCGCRRARSALLPGRRRDRAGRPDHRGAAGAGAAARRRAARHSPRARPRGPRRRGLRGRPPPPATVTLPRASWSPPTRGSTTWSATSGCRCRSR